MIPCPTCRGEGKVRTTKEEWGAFARGVGRLALVATMATGRFAAVWGRRLAMVLGAVMAAPAVSALTYGFAWFISSMTREPLMANNGYKAPEHLADWASVLMTAGILSGLTATGFAAWGVYSRWSR